MKTKLHKILLLTIFAIATTVSLNAQTFTFDSDTEGFTAAANATLAHNATAPGTIDIITGAGGNEGVFVPGTIDADANKFVKVVIKNPGGRNQMRIRINNGGGIQTITPVINGISTGDTTFQTYEFDFSGDSNWVGTAMNIVLQFRANGSGTNTVGELIQIDSVTFSSATTLSTEQNTLEGVAIYPNPVNGELNIKSPVGSDIAIYNVLGAAVKTIKNSNALQSLSVSDLKSGLYFVKITNNSKVFQNKIIKN